MNVEFGDDSLEQVFYDPRSTGGFSRDIVKAFRKRVQQIMSALDERDFYASKGLRFEKLKGKRREQYSMRLNDQYRLILQLKGSGPSRLAVVLSIEDYH